MTRADKPKSKEIKSSYKKWLSNPELTDELRKTIEKVGSPLEIAARKLIKSYGYREEYGRYYQYPNANGIETTHEIDIHHQKELRRAEVHGCAVGYYLRIIGECKYSSTNDFFLFEKERPVTSNFPLILNEERLFSTMAEIHIGDHFKFPAYTQNVSEAHVDEMNFHTADKTIYKASNQLIKAYAAYASSYREGSEEWYNELDEEDEIISKHIEARKKLPTYFDFDAAKPFKSEYDRIGTEFLSDMKSFLVDLAVPIIILGKNNGVIRVKMDEKDNVTDFEDVGYGFFEFTPNNSTPQIKRAEVTEDFPIIICNFDHLNECIKMVEDAMSKVIEQSVNELQLNPIRAYDEALQLFNNYKKREKKRRKGRVL